MALTQVSTGGIKDGQVHTADLANAQITAAKLHADALDRTYTLGADGINHYTFTGEGLTGAVNDPTLYLTRGKTYRFVNGNSSGAHPFRIQSTTGTGGTEYNTGVTNNAGGGGTTIIFEVPHAAPDVLYYQCTAHSNMNGIFYVTGALADGSVTTAKLADIAVTEAKLGNFSVTANKLGASSVSTNALATNSVTTPKIADQAVDLTKLPHGTSSNDGKFLRANNGADPSFETVSAGPTIANQADNRVITATGTTDALNAESTLSFDNNQLTVHDASLKGNQLAFGPSGTAYIDHLTNGQDIQFRTSVSSTNDTVSIKIKSDGNLSFASGKGIDFSATANAALHAPDSIRQTGQGYDPSTDSEILTHYEHGTWTPRLRAYDHTGGAGWGHMVYSDGTVVEGTGRYVRIGRLVMASYQISTGSKVFDSGWTYWSIDTIPFGANHYDGRSGGNYVFQTNAFTQSNSHIGGNVNGADAYLVGNKPNGEYNATINTSNNSRVIRGYALFYTSTG